MYRVARIGAAICGRFLDGYLGGDLVRHDFDLILPFDLIARRSARFGLVFCIVFPLRCGGLIASDRDALGVPTASNQ